MASATTPAPQGVPVIDLRAYLEGEWSIRRTVADRRQAARGTFNGRGTFSPRGGGLLYREEGNLNLGGVETSAYRSYTYHFTHAHRAEVRFDDGRLFHRLDLSAGTFEAEHVCGDDTYRGAFVSYGPNQWRVRWRVSGPCKDQALDSLYIRYG